MNSEYSNIPKNFTIAHRLERVFTDNSEANGKGKFVPLQLYAIQMIDKVMYVRKWKDTNKRAVEKKGYTSGKTDRWARWTPRVVALLKILNLIKINDEKKEGGR